MNIMNISNTNFGAKNPVSRIKFARAIDNTELYINDNVKKVIKKRGDEVESLAKCFDREVLLAQKGNLLLTNSGAKTSYIDMSKIKNDDEIIKGIKDNLVLNHSILK